MIYLVYAKDRDSITLKTCELLDKFVLVSTSVSNPIYVFAKEEKKETVLVNLSVFDKESVEEETVKFFEKNLQKDYVLALSQNPYLSTITKKFSEKLIPFTIINNASFSDILPSNAFYDGATFYDAKKFVELPFYTVTRNVPLIITSIGDLSTAQKVQKKLVDLYGQTLDVTITDGTKFTPFKCEDICAYPSFDFKTSLIVSEQPLLTRERFSVSDLMEIIYFLRGENGCPWDRVQTHESIRSSLVEEAYELQEAIDMKNNDMMCEESGDVLLQGLFHAVIAESNGEFDTTDVLTTLCKKLISRHTHIFGSTIATDATSALASWEAAKAKEKKYNSLGDKIDKIANTLPAGMEAYKIQKVAASVGFDWEDAEQASVKIDEELKEFLSAQKDEKEMEGGDLLFSVVNVLRHEHVNPEIALKRANKKFSDRFKALEKEAIAMGKELKDMTLEEMDEIWNRIKNN